MMWLQLLAVPLVVAQASAAAPAASSVSPWTVAGAVAAAVAAGYATFSARKSERSRIELEKERQAREQDRLDREATDRRQTDLQAECDRCIERLRAAERELVETWQLVGQMQERHRACQAEAESSVRTIAELQATIAQLREQLEQKHG